MIDNKITVITSPDDILIEGVRILLVDLSPEQSEFISASLFQIDDYPNVIVYSWKVGDDIEWLFDKFYKSSVIFFNATSSNQTIVGFLAGKVNTFYFGILQSLNLVNNREICNIDDSTHLLKQLFDNYGT